MSSLAAEFSNTGSHALPRLGVNIDHVATLRQLRGTPYPSIVEAALQVQEAGGAQITVHLREDRRHIQDPDVKALKKALSIPLNLEMAIADPIVRFATKLKPDWACLVPEKRQELTTEGGLNLKKNTAKIKKVIATLKKSGIKVSLFIEPDTKAVQMSKDFGADAVELHTGKYALLTQAPKPNMRLIQKEIKRIQVAALLAHSLGLGSHAGHGLDYQNVRPLAELTTKDGKFLIEEYNIGHSMICRAVSVGLPTAVREMISAIGAP